MVIIIKRERERETERERERDERIIDWQIFHCISSPAFCTAIPTLWMSEPCLASTLSRVSFWALMVFPMSFATFLKFAMIPLTWTFITIIIFLLFIVCSPHPCSPPSPSPCRSSRRTPRKWRQICDQDWGFWHLASRRSLAALVLSRWRRLL